MKSSVTLSDMGDGKVERVCVWLNRENQRVTRDTVYERPLSLSKHDSVPNTSIRVFVLETKTTAAI